MEYTDKPVENVFAPAFGYGYDPDKKPEKDIPEEIPDGKGGRRHIPKGMPRPKNDPAALLIFAVLLLVALIIATLIAAKIETRFLTYRSYPDTVCFHMPHG